MDVSECQCYSYSDHKLEMKKNTYNNEFELFSALLSGDKKAYELFFMTYYNRFCAYAEQFVDHSDAEEIVQDIMVMLWERRAHIDNENNPIGYLFRSVKNRCLKKLMRDQIHAPLNTELYDSIGIDDPNFYIAEELSLKIEVILGEMPATYREAFEMNRYKQMTYQQIGVKLELSPKTVDYRIQKALQILRSGLKDYLPTLSFLFIP